MTDIESLTASLVREYLSRKGLKRTLQVLDQELPRLEHSISNRAILAKEVRIEKLIKKNKEQALVFRTMLEVIVHYLRERGAASATPSSTLSSTSTPSTQELQRPTTAATRERKSSTEKFKVPLPKSSELEDPDMSKEDYSDLLKRLEKSEQPIKTRDVLHTNTPISLTQKPHYSSHSDNTVTPSPTPRAKTPRAKTARTRARTAGLGGPVVSSGLAGGREKRGLHVKSYSSDLSVTGHNFHTDRTKGTDDNGLRASNWEKLDYDSTIVQTEKESLDDSTKSVKNIIQVDLQNNLLGTETKQNKSSRPMSSLSKKSNYQPQLQRKDELVFEDIDDDLDESLSSLSLGSSQQIEADFESKPISLEQAMALKNLIFGSAKSSFNQEWRQQSFNFCDIYGLEYGIVQHKGGPCGVLAAVQSFVLKSLLFGDQRKSDPKHPTSRERTKALATAITEILWRAGQGQSAVVALPTGFGNSNFIGAGRYKPDQLTENLVLRTFSSQQSLHSYVYQQIRQFEDQSSSGCILLLYSTILSRTIKSVISDMDDPNTKLMGAHGYCTQEMVNLITTGKATSNAFDNTIELDSGGSNVLLLKGLEKQADVGLLSLFEHYESCQVGNYYKTPKYPIWVICSESHFSVMFSTDRILLENWDHKEKFDVYYYDGLSRQEEEIRLTIDTSKECPESKDGDLVPPLEHVIRTRWKKASVDWNGSEPIL